jgi:hypothetical protein
MIWITFVMLFVAGPLTYLRLTRRAPTGQRLAFLAVLAGVAILAGLSLRYGAGGHWGYHAGLTITALCLLWLAWIAVLALGAQSLARFDRTAQTRRWTRVIGSAGTTAPWFGMAAASWITG